MNLPETSLSLRQFQSELNDRARAPEASSAWLALNSSGIGWLVDLAQTEEAMLAPPISAIGDMPAGVLGIAAARSKVFTVLDMPALLSDAPSQQDETGGWVVTVSQKLLPGPGLAMWWPGLSGVVLDAGFVPARVPRPALARASYHDAEGQLWHVLDLPALMQRVEGLSALQAAAGSEG